MLKTQITKRILKISKLAKQGKNTAYVEELKKFKRELEAEKREIELGIVNVEAKIKYMEGK